MNVIKKHWKWYDPAKGDLIDAESGGVTRAGANLSEMVEEEGVTYPESSFVATGSGLKYVVTKEGIGARSPPQGSVARCHYCGWLGGFERGAKFDSSRDKGKVFETQVGVGAVIEGWDECLLGMKKKEQRMLVVPPKLGYGDAGAGGGVIPGGATLYFHLELLSWS